MARNNRRNKILELITNKDIETQEELVELLRKERYDVTQATVSRDIKELGLVKVLTEDKKYKYATGTNSSVVSDKLIKMAKDCILSITQACNLVIVKCINGVAELVEDMVQQLNIEEIIGLATGKNTVMIAAINENNALIIKNKIDNIVYS